MKIVQCEDGSYGIRKFSFNGFKYKYLDLKYDEDDSLLWWSSNSKWFYDCTGSIELVTDKFNEINPKVKIILSTNKFLFKHKWIRVK